MSKKTKPKPKKRKPRLLDLVLAELVRHRQILSRQNIILNRMLDTKERKDTI